MVEEILSILNIQELWVVHMILLYKVLVTLLPEWCPQEFPSIRQIGLILGEDLEDTEDQIWSNGLEADIQT